MNKTIKTAYEMQEAPFERSLPEVEVGDICKLEDIWDGEGDAPEESYSYQLTDTDWINYTFDVEEENDDKLKTVVRITGIELL